MAKSKKRKKKKKNTGPKTPKQPSNFKSFQGSVGWVKKCVYLIARGKKQKINGKEGWQWQTLGSGFIAAPQKFVTAAHVISDPNQGKSFQHEDGDKYYLIRHDDENHWHYRIWEPKLDKDIFLYKDVDLAVINLDKEFYQNNGKIYVDNNTFLKIDKNLHGIGSEIGVLGYPLCKLTFDNGDVTKPRIGNILLRGDVGVVNCTYKSSSKLHHYEFTLAFNPGNSGGPIFDIKTGRLVSIVKGFKSIPIKIKESELTDLMRKNLKIKKYTPDSYLEVMHANYSIGFATPSFSDVFKEHKIGY